jgi:phosphoenolpyruvate-protein kinase (PTS system EI component)
VPRATVIPFGFGRFSGRLQTVRHSNYDFVRAPDDRVLRVPFLPTPEEFVELANEVRPTMMILPPVSPYSHLASAIWCSEIPVAATSEIDRLSDGQPVAVDFDVGQIIYAEPILAGLSNWTTVNRKVQLCDPAKREFGSAMSLPHILSEVGSVLDGDRAARDLASGLGVVKVEQLAADVSGTLGLKLASFAKQSSDLRSLCIRYFDTESGVPGVSGRWIEPKPSLGVRGVRGIAQESLLEAFASLLQPFRESEVTIVLPMVTSASEVRAARRVLGTIGPRWTLGVTVETPAAALTISEIVSEVAFVEVGLNDLTQYTLAWDRNVVNENLLPHLQIADAVAPMVGAVFASCANAGVYCTLGLDLRPSSSLAAELRSLGVTSISCSPPLVPRWRQAYLDIDCDERL